MTLLRWKLRRGCLRAGRAAGKKLFSCNAFHEACESFKALRASFPKAVRGIVRTFCGACSHLTRCVFSRQSRAGDITGRGFLTIGQRCFATRKATRVHSTEKCSTIKRTTLEAPLGTPWPFLFVSFVTRQNIAGWIEIQNKQPCLFEKDTAH